MTSKNAHVHLKGKSRHRESYSEHNRSFRDDVAMTTDDGGHDARKKKLIFCGVSTELKGISPLFSGILYYDYRPP